MMLDRRTMLKGLTAGCFSSPLALHNTVNAATANRSSAPRRIIFFLQNNGFHPETAVPAGLSTTASLQGHRLPEHIEPLQELTDRMNIIHGLHGRHTNPDHSAFFGALGGYNGGARTPPRGATIDHVLSQELPKTVLPHLCLGMAPLETMRTRPTEASLSAAGAGEKIFMECNPQNVFRMIFGSVAGADVQSQYMAESSILDQVEAMAEKGAESLPSVAGRDVYDQYVKSFDSINGMRERLANESSRLKKSMPQLGEGFNKPQFETDWHDAMLEIGISMLKADMTNVLTIGSGLGGVYGAWQGLGVQTTGHSLGHIHQPKSDEWIKIRQYNCQMLVKIVKALESVPEGTGTMMDNTLIVYTSSCGDKQHTAGQDWPFITIGDWGGRIATGQYINAGGQRPINAFYTTLLNALEIKLDRFNMDRKTAVMHDPKIGPIGELLA